MSGENAMNMPTVKTPQMVLAIVVFVQKAPLVTVIPKDLDVTSVSLFFIYSIQNIMLVYYSCKLLYWTDP